MPRARNPLRHHPRAVRSLTGDRRAATAVEYGLIAALIVVVMLVGLKALAGTTIGMWGNINSQVTSSTPR